MCMRAQAHAHCDSDRFWFDCNDRANWMSTNWHSDFWFHVCAFSVALKLHLNITTHKHMHIIDLLSVCSIRRQRNVMNKRWWKWTKMADILRAERAHGNASALNKIYNCSWNKNFNTIVVLTKNANALFHLTSFDSNGLRARSCLL